MAMLNFTVGPICLGEICNERETLSYPIPEVSISAITSSFKATFNFSMNK